MRENTGKLTRRISSLLLLHGILQASTMTDRMHRKLRANFSPPWSSRPVRTAAAAQTLPEQAGSPFAGAAGRRNHLWTIGGNGEPRAESTTEQEIMYLPRKTRSVYGPLFLLPEQLP